MVKKTTGRIVVVMEQLRIVTHHTQVIQLYRTKHTHIHTSTSGTCDKLSGCSNGNTSAMKLCYIVLQMFPLGETA